MHGCKDSIRKSLIRVVVIAASLLIGACGGVSLFPPGGFSVEVITTHQQTAPEQGSIAQRVVVTLTANPVGGTAPYRYAWSAINPLGEKENERLSSLDTRSTVFTGGDTSGLYEVTCVVTDAFGRRARESVIIANGQALTVDVQADHAWVTSGGGSSGQTTVSVEVAGGTPPYTYAWSVTDPSGEVDDTCLNDMTSATAVFTSGSKSGSYVVSCTVRDAFGVTFTDSVSIIAASLLSLDVSADRQQLTPEGGEWGVAFLEAQVTGGTPDYTYSWTVTNPAQETDNDRLSSLTSPTPTFTSSHVKGVYRVACTVTDAAGQQLTDSVLIMVGPGLLLTVSVTRQEVAAAGGGVGQTELSATIIGGTAPFTYIWSVTDPNGRPDDHRLDSVTSPTPTFTSWTTLGTYHIFCTVTDAEGRVGFDSTEVYVGQPLGVDVATDRQDVPADGGTAHLTATAIGGLPPYNYSWQVYDPSGAVENNRLDNIRRSNPVFTSSLTIGTYTATCLVTDSGGFTAIDSVGLVVGGGLDQGLTLSVTTSRQHVPNSGGTAILAAAVTGGVAPVAYAWTILDPSDNDVTAATLSSSVVANPTFTAPATVGTYRARCTVTDSVSKTFTDSVDIYVGQNLSVSVNTSRQGVVPGGGANGQATLNAAVSGGAGGYTYLWAVTNPSGAAEDARLSATNVQSPTFTSAATVGTYRVSCTVTDADGSVFVNSVDIYVGFGLSASITTSRSTIMPGGGANGQATLNASAIGGNGSYTYLWAVTNPSGASEDARLSSTTAQSPTFTSAATVGTYRVTCTVTDGLGTQYTAATHIYVGQTLSLSVTTSRQSVVPGGGANGQAILNAAASGGAGGYTYLWAVTNPSGAGEDARLSSTTVQSPTFTSAATVGTYRLSCTVTDSNGLAVANALDIYVGFGLSASITTSRSTIMPGGGANGQATLSASAIGGDGSYSYLWAVTNPSGAAEDARLSATNVQSPIFTSAATVGTYRVTCTITDGLGTQYAGAVQIFVGNTLSVSITQTRSTVVPGGGANGQSTLTATPLSGASPYTYLWTVTNPSGGAEDARLSATTVQAPVFTSAATVGTYRIVCTVTDNLGATFAAATHITVGNWLSARITTNRTRVMPGGGANGQASLSATVLGGASPYTYLWAVTDPSGNSADARLSATNVASPTFTSDATIGTYRIACTVTDSYGMSVTNAVHVTVGNWLSANVTTNRTRVIPGGGANGQASLNAAASGGAGGYTYLWTVTNPSGAGEDARLDATSIQSPTFTSDATIGTYRVSCQVTDSVGATFTASVNITVTQDLSVSLTTNRTRIVPGGGANGQAALDASAIGGAGGYTYLWTVTNPSGAAEDARLSATNVQSPTFTSSATVGTYRVVCTVTDSVGVTFKSALHLYVSQDLSVSITTSRVRVVPGGGVNGRATLDASASGGAGGYTYLWGVTNPSGGAEDARLDATNVQTPIFTSAATVGTYRIVCTVTDAVGVTFSGAVHVIVTQDLSANITTNRSRVVPGGGVNGQATLSANAIGGEAPYTYLWAVTNPSGASEDARLSSTTVQSPTFTSDATVGTYRASCTVTDNAGVTFTGSVNIVVTQDLSAYITNDRTLVLPGGGSTGQANLTVTATGGAGGYTYLWAVTNPSGGAENARLSATNVANPVFTSAATQGTYRVTCTVTDSLGASVTNSVHIEVGQPAVFLDVRGDKLLLLPGEKVNLVGDRVGGKATFNYDWHALDSSGAEQGTWDGDDDGGTPGGQQNARADDVSQGWTAPADAYGTYRIYCTITDANGYTFTDSLQVQVTTAALTLTTPAEADPDNSPTSILGSTNFYDRYVIVKVNVTLTYPRTLKVRVTDANSSMGDDLWVVVAGAGPQGLPQMELLEFGTPGAAKTVETSRVFSRVDQVFYQGRPTGTIGTDERIMIGVGNTFGLPEVISSASAVRKVTLLPNTTLVKDTDYTVITTPGQQGIRFINAANDPDNANSYQILYDDN